MAKPYYADYVNHILRFYFRYDCSKGFKNDVDKRNYTAADKVVKRLSVADQAALSVVFRLDDNNLMNNVVLAASLNGTDAAKVWSLVSTTTVKVAKERGLL